MSKYKVLASVVSLPGEPAYQDATVDASEFNDEAHINRLIASGHIEPIEDEPKSKVAKSAAKGDIKSDNDLRAIAKDLGFANADNMNRSALDAAISAAGK